MKKLIALCMAMVMSLALLAGCASADPNNPYSQEPAPMVGASSDADAEAEAEAEGEAEEETEEEG